MKKASSITTNILLAIILIFNMVAFFVAEEYVKVGAEEMLGDMATDPYYDEKIKEETYYSKPIYEEPKYSEPAEEPTEEEPYYPDYPQEPYPVKEPIDDQIYPEELYYPEQPIEGSIVESSTDITSECEQHGISNLEDCRKFMSYPPECRSQGFEDWQQYDECMKTSYPESVDQPYPEEEPYLGEEVKPTPTIYDYNEVMPECKEQGITTTDECHKYLAIPPECRQQGILDWQKCDQFMRTPPECRDKNLSDEECYSYMMLPPECREQGVLDEIECKKVIQQFSMPPECQQAGITDMHECKQVIFLNSMPQECKQSGATSKEECDRIMMLPPECIEQNIMSFEQCDQFIMETHLAPECKEAGASTIKECDLIMREKYSDFAKMAGSAMPMKPIFEHKYFDQEAGMPPECREQGIITPEQCEKIIFAKDMPPECEQAGATSKEECDKVMFSMHMPLECSEAGISDPKACEDHMMQMHMPPECRKAGAKTDDDCERIMFAKHAPPECRDAGATTPEECEKIMFREHAPDDCKEVGILTMEACKKYMFEKYGGIENIPAEKLPPECQKQGATTPEECEKVMQTLYMPQECKDHGLTSEQECKQYMEQKYMPKECREAGSTTREECDKVMFKKYGPKECSQAGITNDKECEEFMFNKYVPKVKCQGIDDWQCKNAFKQRHLGNVVAKQVKFNEIKEKAKHLTSDSTTAEDLEEVLEIAEDIIPIQKKETSFKIVAAKEEIILDEDEKLIQTPAVALMIDADQDGLSDDMEERIGTDPELADSDYDGYQDKVEIKNNYNPLGPGELKIAIAPVDEAILNNQILGQPKTEGEVSDDLVIENIINIKDEQGKEVKNCHLTGKAQANSVVSLYLYSDLPVIITTKADKYGNWQYQLKQSLLDGEHEVYLALNDNTGRVIAKSNSMNFFVKEAKAVSVKDFVASPVPTTIQQESTKSIKVYILAIVFAVIAGLIFFIVYFIQKRKHLTKY